MNKLKGIINSMDYEELRDVQRDLSEGNLGKLITEKIKKYETLVIEKTCPTCGNSINKEARYVLIFGPLDFRKRAYFCGLDCLNFFINNNLKHKQVV